jgi:Flp pilus assembly protein TadG
METTLITTSRYSRHRSGAAAVEFSIAATVLFTVIFASVEFARLTMLKHAVEHASYIAARKGIIVGAKVTQVKQAALDHLDKFQLSSASVTVTPSDIKDDTQVVEVITTVPIAGNSWISPLYFGGNLTGRTRMLTERVAAEMSAAQGATAP